MYIESSYLPALHIRGSAGALACATARLGLAWRHEESQHQSIQGYLKMPPMEELPASFLS